MAQSRLEVNDKRGFRTWKDASWPKLRCRHVLEKNLVLAYYHPNALEVDNKGALSDQYSSGVGAGNLQQHHRTIKGLDMCGMLTGSFP